MSTFSPQYTYFHSDPKDDNPNYVNEYVLCPTLSWTSFYHISNTLSLPLYNTPHDNELCSTQLYFLTILLIHQHDNFTLDINTLTLKTPHHFFLTSSIVLKILPTRYPPKLRSHHPDVYKFCPLTKLLNVDEARPLIVPHEFLQPVKVPIL